MEGVGVDEIVVEVVDTTEETELLIPVEVEETT
jgi:hypothetical protein